MMTALIPLAEGFEEIEAVTIVDVLRRGSVDVVTASIGSGLAVAGAHKMTVTADCMIGDVAADDFDAIVLPGGSGTPRLAECAALVEMLREQSEAGKIIAAICAAPAVLCRIGVVPEDVSVTCYPTCADGLDHFVDDVPVIADANIITGRAPGSAMLFALVVLKALVGDVVAGRVARGLVTDVLD